MIQVFFMMHLDQQYYYNLFRYIKVIISYNKLYSYVNCEFKYFRALNLVSVA